MHSGAVLEPAPQEILRKRGFLIQKINGELRAQIEEVYRAGGDFFVLPLSQKMAERRHCNAGYRPYGIERATPEGQFDQMESFSFIRRIMGTPASNIGTVAALKRSMLSCWDSFADLAESLVRELARGTSDEEQPHLEPHGAFRRWSWLQLNSRFLTDEIIEFTNELHEDACILTLMSNTGPGFEMLTPEKAFVPIQLGSDELLVFPGQALNLLTRGAFSPSYHRVRMIPGQEKRMALSFFADLDPARCSSQTGNASTEAARLADFVLKSPTQHGLEEFTFESESASSSSGEETSLERI